MGQDYKPEEKVNELGKELQNNCNCQFILSIFSDW